MRLIDVLLLATLAGCSGDKFASGSSGGAGSTSKVVDKSSGGGGSDSGSTDGGTGTTSGSSSGANTGSANGGGQVDDGSGTLDSGEDIQVDYDGFAGSQSRCLDGHRLYNQGCVLNGNAVADCGSMACVAMIGPVADICAVSTVSAGAGRWHTLTKTFSICTPDVLPVCPANWQATPAARCTLDAHPVATKPVSDAPKCPPRHALSQAKCNPKEVATNQHTLFFAPIALPGDAAIDVCTNQCNAGGCPWVSDGSTVSTVCVENELPKCEASWRQYGQICTFE